MQVDFYQLKRDPVERVLPVIAQRLMDQGARLIVVDGRADALARLSRALWDWRAESFLAHGLVDDEDAVVHPILLGSDLGETPSPANCARHVALTDGVWRDSATSFERAFYFFDDQTLEQARGCWRLLKNSKDVEPRFWRQEGRGWVQGP